MGELRSSVQRDCQASRWVWGKRQLLPECSFCSHRVAFINREICKQPAYSQDLGHPLAGPTGWQCSINEAPEAPHCTQQEKGHSLELLEASEKVTHEPEKRGRETLALFREETQNVATTGVGWMKRGKASKHPSTLKWHGSELTTLILTALYVRLKSFSETKYLKMAQGLGRLLCV